MILAYYYLTSKGNERLKLIRKLGDKKYRYEERQFIFEGAHLLEEYLRAGFSPEEIFVCDDAAEKYSELISASGCDKVYIISRELYKSISEERSPQGILCVCGFLDGRVVFDDDLTGKVPESGALLLEAIRDAGNLGTVIRTAASLGIDNIYISEDCADLYNSKTVRASMGALFFSDIRVVTELCVVAEALKARGSRVFAAVLREDALKLGEFEVLPSDSFVIGNEGNGISERLIDCCGLSAAIPMSGRTESLNAAAAATIFLWEMTRARHKAKGSI